MRLRPIDLAVGAVMIALTPRGHLLTNPKKRESLLLGQNTLTAVLFHCSAAVLPGGIFSQVACYIVWIEL